MKKPQLTLTIKLGLIASLVLLAGNINSTVRAQAVRGQQDLGLREHQMSELERAPAKKREAKDVMAEVNEDLRRLGVLHEGITASLAATNQPLNPQAFMDSSTEIKTRALQLRTDLALPFDEKATHPDPLKGMDSKTLQPMVAVLDKLLESFLHNPVFTDQGAVDMQLAAKARLDLEDIITVSEKVRKTAEKLSKSH